MDSAEKASLRATLLARRSRLDDAGLRQAAGAVTASVVDVVRAAGAATVACYQPVGREPGAADLPARIAAVTDMVLLPVLLPDLDLDWAVYSGPGTLALAARGLREPTGPRLGVMGITQADLVIVPALAVDRSGNRLGRGGGSYDRALARVPARVPVVALLHLGELLTRVPAQPHDRPVTAAVTPDTVTYCAAG